MWVTDFCTYHGLSTSVTLFHRCWNSIINNGTRLYLLNLLFLCSPLLSRMLLGSILLFKSETCYLPELNRLTTLPKPNQSQCPLSYTLLNISQVSFQISLQSVQSSVSSSPCLPLQPHLGHSFTLYLFLSFRLSWVIC